VRETPFRVRTLPKKRVCSEKLDDAGGSFRQQVYLMLLADRASAATACNPLSSSLFDSAQLAHKNHYSPWSEGKNTTLSALKCWRCKISSLFSAFMNLLAHCKHVQQ
jgi:hypothetical protein